MVFVLGMTGASAQDSTYVGGKNFLKVNLSSIVFNNYSFQYERVLGKRWSIALGYSFRPSGEIPFSSTVKGFADEEDDATTFLIDNAKIGATAITPEIRWYLGKGYGRGFYIAPYYRYTKFEAENVQVAYVDQNGDDQTVRMGGDITANSFGLMFGAQWTIGKHFTIDWWILGAHIGTASGDIAGVTTQVLTQDEQDQVRDVLEGFEIPFIDSEVQTSSSGAVIKMDGSWGGIRAFGVNVGYRF